MKILLLSLILVLAGCPRYPTKSALKEICEKYDPSSHKLEGVSNSYVQRTFIDDEKVELGVIQMKDGSTSKYWFRSHHLTDDIGGTWFLLSDGEKRYMPGYFCCEAQFPDEQFQSLSDLRIFIRKHSGINP